MKAEKERSEAEKERMAAEKKAETELPKAGETKTMAIEWNP